MALKIVTKKRYIHNVQKITLWISEAFGIKTAKEFISIVESKLILVSNKPHLGTQTGLKNVRSILVGKGFQNKIYYTIKGDSVVIINMIDTRRNPQSNPFNKAR